MSRRRRILVNNYEVATFKILQNAVAQTSARVFAKVGVKDALDIRNSGLAGEEYSYALRAHFDYVIAREETEAAFAVEFDGQAHDTDPETVHRDNLKNSICVKLEMPLLRIDSSFLRRVGEFIILEWLVNLWFMNEEFERQQAEGLIAYDEEFDYRAVFGFAYVENNKLVEIDMNGDVPVAEWFIQSAQGKVVVTNPVDPFHAARMFIHQCWRAKKCSRLRPPFAFAIDPHGRHVALEVLKLPEDKLIIGVGRCRTFEFPPVGPWDLAPEFAMLNAAQLLKAHLQGEPVASPPSAFEEWKKEGAKWKRHI